MLMLQRAIHVCHDLTSKTREPNQQQPGGHVYTVRYITSSIARPNVCFFLEDTRHIYTEKSVFSHLSDVSDTYNCTLLTHSMIFWKPS